MNRFEGKQMRLKLTQLSQAIPAFKMNLANRNVSKKELVAISTSNGNK